MPQEFFILTCTNGHIKRVRRSQLSKYVAGRYVNSEFVPAAGSGKALQIQPEKCDTCIKHKLAKPLV